MKYLLFAILLCAILIAAGCVGGDQKTVVTPVQTTSILPTPTDAPTTILTPTPTEMAYLQNVSCAIDPTSETAYHCNGKVLIKSGVYSSVLVIAKYSDNNTFNSDIVAMGGSNPTLKKFAIFPDNRYQNQNPTFFVKLDNVQYPVIMEGDSGIAYLNPLSTPSISTTSPTVNTISTNLHVTAKPTTQKTTIPMTTTISNSIPTITGVYPSTVSPGSFKLIIKGSNFRQYPPTSVYLNRHDSLDKLGGQSPSSVVWHSSTEMECSYYIPANEGDGTTYYDILVTNSYLQDSNSQLPYALTIIFPTRTTITPIIITP
jgi:hypothetical protein